ncbi:Uncharacterized protein B5E39_3938 [Bacillus cereus]|nr:Uncharacterized protein B5E39_3938 [Bacillus cereus]
MKPSNRDAGANSSRTYLFWEIRRRYIRNFFLSERFFLLQKNRLRKFILRRKGLRITVTLEKYVKLRSTVYEYMIEQDKPISLLDIQEHIVSHHEGKFTKKMLHQFYLSRLLDELKLDGKITLADEYLYAEKGVLYKARKGS